MFIIEFIDLITVNVIQHGDLTAVTILTPAFLAINENWIISIIRLEGMLSDLCMFIYRLIAAFSAYKVGIISCKRWVF